ncbi:hypothetical protein JCM24511_01759 [Saitozyma sp. JCM 24511]|nr:hypothetical protein JCM24511_01759 [Saitozyma sp. JCM 24511]
MADWEKKSFFSSHSGELGRWKGYSLRRCQRERAWGADEQSLAHLSCLGSERSRTGATTDIVDGWDEGAIGEDEKGERDVDRGRWATSARNPGPCVVNGNVPFTTH